jgi:hypothetical protein
LQNIFLPVGTKRFDSVQKVHEKFTRSEGGILNKKSHRENQYKFVGLIASFLAGVFLICHYRFKMDPLGPFF